jgi:vancomycin resistance protein VanJ
VIRGLRFAESLVARALRVWLGAGILLRITGVRDHFQAVAVVFYTTPWPVIAIGLALISVHHWRSQRSGRTRLYGVLSIIALGIWIALSWRHAPQTVQPNLRLVFWNVARPYRQLPRVGAFLRAQNADVIVIAEAATWYPPMVDRWQNEFPGYAKHASPGDMLCLVRGTIVASENGTLVDRSTYAIHRLLVRGREISLLHVDVFARPLLSRREPLHRLTELVRSRQGEKLLVVGDFNTPRDSAHLDGLRALTTNCFERAGRGFVETWPNPLPVLALDQMWAGRGILPVRCVSCWTWLSDHCAVIGDFRVE